MQGGVTAAIAAGALGEPPSEPHLPDFESSRRNCEPFSCQRGRRRLLTHVVPISCLCLPGSRRKLKKQKRRELKAKVKAMGSRESETTVHVQCMLICANRHSDSAACG